MIAITTADDICHLVDSPESIAAIESPNTRAALQAAYDAGNWEPYTPPATEAEQPLPNWPAFRLALQQADSFREWSERLPATWREDLKLAAIAANAEALQGIYNLLAQQHTPEYEAALEWQAIADEHFIPVTF